MPMVALRVLKSSMQSNGLAILRSSSRLFLKMLLSVIQTIQREHPRLAKLKRIPLLNGSYVVGVKDDHTLVRFQHGGQEKQLASHHLSGHFLKMVSLNSQADRFGKHPRPIPQHSG